LQLWKDGVRKGRQPFVEHVHPYTYTYSYTRCERLQPQAEQVPSFVYVYEHEHDSAPGTSLNRLRPESCGTGSAAERRDVEIMGTAR